MRKIKDVFGSTLSLLLGSSITIALILFGIVLVLLSPFLILLFIGDHAMDRF